MSSRATGRRRAQASARLDTTIDLLQPTGPRTYATVRCAGQPLVAELQAHDVSAVGAPIALDIDLRRHRRCSTRRAAMRCSARGDQA